MPLQPVALADTYRNISLKQDSLSASFSTLTANAVTDTLTLVAGPGISFATGPDTIAILNDFGDENATLSIRALLVDNVSIDTNVIQITESNANLELRANGSGSVYVNDALVVENNLTVKGDAEIQGGDLTTNQTTFNLLNTTATTVNLAGAATTINIGSTTGTITLNNALVETLGDLTVKGGDISTNQFSFNLLNNTATSINFAGAGTLIEIGAATGSTNINHNLDVDGNLNVDGSSITTSNTTFNVANANATTGNLFGAASTINIGIAGSSGILTIRNDSTVLQGDLQIQGGDLTTNQTTFNLLNTTATTVNFAGAATTLEIGSATGNTNINNNLDIDGDLNIDGGDFTTSASTFNLLPTTATTVNFAGSAANINMGNVTTINNLPGAVNVGSLNVTTSSTFQGPIVAQNDVTVWGSLNLTGDINGGPLRTDDIQIVGNRIETTVSNSNLELNTVGSGSIDLFANTNISGNLVINSQLTLSTASISTVSGNTNLNISAHGTGSVNIETLSIIGNNIDTTDSSGISITPAVTFQSDIIAENGIHTQGHIVPDTDLIYKLGGEDRRFSSAYIEKLILVNDLETKYGGTGSSSFTTNGILYGNSDNPLSVTAASNPGSNATTSFGILTTDGSNIPVWTDVIDGGSY